jgi:serine/threonine protein kinase
VIGKKLADRYEITAELGRGGMGVVYRAQDPLLNRDVAVKLIPPAQLSRDSEQRFQHEAQLVAQMDHPAIVSIHDFGRHEGSLFFVMPLVQGTNLRAFLRQDSVLGDVLDISIQVAEALEYSHARGVVHRDIKPENIMVSREEGAGVRVRVMDFGLARSETESRLTKTGTLLGTLCYLSPEQVTSKPVDSRADIYAFGTVLYECVVGEPPFSGEVQSVLYRIVHELPQPPRSLGAAIDEELENIIMACLAKEAVRRPPRAGEVAEALKRYRSRLRDSERARSVTGFTRTYQAPRPALSPFIGRAKEFAEIQQRLNAAVAGECQFVVVAGEPGIGKTRLLDELENLAKARQILVLHGQSTEQDRSFPYLGFCEVIQEYFRLKESASSSLPDFSDLAADLVSLFPTLNEVSHIRSAATGDPKLSRAGSAGPENRTEIFELLARALTRIAGGKPLVLILEDLHGAEVSLEALQYIVRRLGPTPSLILGSYRSTEVDARHPLTRMLDSFRGNRRFSSLALGPFSASEHRSLLETLVGGPQISDSLARRLYDGSEGNPFFTKELVRSLLDSGAIARDASGAWSLSREAGLAADALPATIQEAVEKRIQGLPDDLKEVLSIASVVGKSFGARELEALAEGKGDVEDALDRLVQQGLIEEERESRGDVLTFSSRVVRDVLYGALCRDGNGGLSTGDTPSISKSGTPRDSSACFPSSSIISLRGTCRRRASSTVLSSPGPLSIPSAPKRRPARRRPPSISSTRNGKETALSKAMPGRFWLGPTGCLETWTAPCGRPPRRFGSSSSTISPLASSVLWFLPPTPPGRLGEPRMRSGGWSEEWPPPGR